MSFDNILSFLLYVIPGFLSTEIYRIKYPGKKDTDFSRLTWSITLSIIIYVISKGFDQLFKLNLYPANLSFPKTRTILVLFILAVILAYFRIAQRRIAERYSILSFLKTKPLSIWTQINNQDPAEWAYVTLVNGDKYLGWISSWSYDPNEKEYDFLLSDAKKVNADLEIYYEIPGQGVYLKTSNVLSIEFFGGTNKEAVSLQELNQKEVASSREKKKKAK